MKHYSWYFCVESVSWNLAKRRNGTCWTTASRPARVGARQGRGEGLVPKAGDVNVEPLPLLCRVVAVQRGPYAQREHGGNSHYWALSNFAWQEQRVWEDEAGKEGSGHADFRDRGGQASEDRNEPTEHLSPCSRRQTGHFQVGRNRGSGFLGLLLSAVNRKYFNLILIIYFNFKII